MLYIRISLQAVSKLFAVAGQHGNRLLNAHADDDDDDNSVQFSQ